MNSLDQPSSYHRRMLRSQDRNCHVLNIQASIGTPADQRHCSWCLAILLYSSTFLQHRIHGLSSWGRGSPLQINSRPCSTKNQLDCLWKNRVTYDYIANSVVLTAVRMKTALLWDIILCRLVQIM